MKIINIKTESFAKRCEICHKADCFDPVKNYCSRCEIVGKGITNSIIENNKNLSTKIKKIIKDELKEDEEVFWLEKPLFRKMVLKLLPALILELICIILLAYWMIHTIGAKSLILVLFFYCFVMAANITTFLEIYRSYRKIYILTDQRAIIIDDSFNIEVQSFFPEKLISVVKRKDKNSTGDLIFEIKEFEIKKQKQTKEIGFLCIADVDRVEKLVMNIYKRTRI